MNDHIHAAGSTADSSPSPEPSRVPDLRVIEGDGGPPEATTVVGSDNGHPPRVEYADAGRAMRAAVAKAHQHRLTDIQHRVLLAVLTLTASYSKLEDDVYVAKVAEAAGKDPDENGDYRSVRRALTRLSDLGIIEWEPARGRGRKSTLRLPRATEENRPHRADRFSVENRSEQARKTGHPGWPPTEKQVLEESSRQYESVQERPAAAATSSKNPVVSKPPLAGVAGESSSDESSGADRSQKRRTELDRKLAEFDGLNSSTVALVRQEFQQWPGGVLNVVGRALVEGDNPRRFLTHLLKEREHQVADVLPLPRIEPSPVTRPPQPMLIECMACGEKTACTDDGERVLCDTCRQPGDVQEHPSGSELANGHQPEAGDAVESRLADLGG